MKDRLIMNEIYNKPRGPTANCLVLHDFSNKNPDIKSWFEFTLNFFKEYGLSPNRLSSYNEKSKKTVDFNKGIKSFYRTNFEHVTSMWFSHKVDGDVYDDNAYLVVWLSLAPDKKNHTLAIGFDNDVIGLNPKTINTLAKNMADYFSPQYGYLYQRSYNKGPLWYPFGTISGLDLDKDREEIEAITKWLHMYHINNKYKPGDLRDIYPLNLLSHAHQEHTVEGKSFFDWIQTDPKRGSLTKLNASLWAWWVDVENIPYVRETLRPLGWILAI